MKNLRSELKRIGAAAGAIAAASASFAAYAQTDELALEEIVVTAQRRAETLQNVPVAVTAITADDLATRDIRDYGTYLASVPGAAFQETTGIGGEIKLRGIGTGINAQMSPTTAVYFGDVPVIHTGRNVNASYNFFLSDIERIEVLRGPQGQLFGSNSLGGAIRNIPAQPELGASKAAFEAGGAAVADGGNDHSVQAMVNIPIGDAVALRLVGYSAYQAGWYDNVFTGGPRLGSIQPAPLPPFLGGQPTLPIPGQALPGIIALNPAAADYSAPAPGDREDTNSVDTNGGRAILKWQMTDALTATLMAVYEEKEYGGAMFAEYSNPGTFPPFGFYPPDPNGFRNIDYRSYEHHEAAQAGGGDKIELYNLVLDYNFGPATLTSTTSYWERNEDLDLSISIGTFVQTGIPESAPVVNYRNDNPKVTTQEFRLTSNTDGALDWLIGAFWQEIDQDHTILAQDLSGLDLAYSRQVVLANAFGFPPPGTRVIADNRSNYKDEQLAVFGQIGFDFAERWHAAVSARYFTLEQEFSATTGGFQFGLAAGAQSGENDDDVFTPRVELSYSPEDGKLVYASASEGFRTGIINRAIPTDPFTCGAELANVGYPNGLPPSEADTTLNYELGAKLDLADGRARLNVAVFYIDWSDMQMNVPLAAYNPQGSQFSNCQYDAVLNVGDATSAGAEVEFIARLTQSLQFDTALSYTDAQFDTDLLSLGIESGDKLPLTPDITAFTGLQWNFALGARPTYLRGEWQYVGEKEPFATDFPADQYPNGAPYTIGDYSVVNLRAGVDLSDSVTFQVYADNVADEFGITSSNSTGGLGFPFVTTIRPRTYGATLRVRF